MHKLRIGFVAAGTSGHIGPYLRFFSGREHKVSWFAYDAPIPDHRVPTFDISCGAAASCSSSKWRYFLAGLKLRHLLRRFPVDVLYAHYATAGGVIAWLSGFQPVVIRAQGSDLLIRQKTSIWRALLRRILLRSALVHVMSSELAEAVHMLTNGRVPSFQATTGVPVERFAFKMPQADRRPLRILCTRWLSDVYDPGTVVKACLKMDRDHLDFVLNFAGSGSLEATLKSQIAEAGLADRVQFGGGYTAAQLPAIVQAHDIYVSASLSDGTSISLLEAMAAGLFPVVSRIRSNLEWLEDGVSCLMFDCGQHDMLAAEILRAAQRECFCKDAAVRNRQLVERKGDQRKNLLLVESELTKVVRAREEQQGDLVFNC